jgi:hypothetical protein
MSLALLNLLTADPLHLHTGVVGETAWGAAVFLAESDQPLQVWGSDELRIVAVRRFAVRQRFVAFGLGFLVSGWRRRGGFLFAWIVAFFAQWVVFKPDLGLGRGTSHFFQ